jgi:hypothetical protein
VTNEQARRETLLQLLDHWRDFFCEPSGSGQASSDDDGRMLAADWSLFSSMARWSSVVEMKRCVDLLEGLCRHTERSHHAHLMAYSCKADWRLAEVPVKRRDAKGKWIVELQRQRVRLVPGWVVLRMVDRAVDFILCMWSQDVPLELPPALTLKLRPLADADGWTEAA